MVLEEPGLFQQLYFFEIIKLTICEVQCRARHFVARSSRASISVPVTPAAAAGDSLRVLYAALNVGRRNVLGVGVAVNEVFLCQRHCAEL
jgi:hypothetical protein